MQSPNRLNTTRSNDKRKLTPAEERRLIHEYGIRFEGPILTSHWPPQYSLIYGKLREIEGVKYDQYRSSLDSSPHRVKRVRSLNRAHTLIRAAHDCRKSSLHEEEWRRSTEAHLLKHFDGEVECPARQLCVCNPNETIRDELSSDVSRPFLTQLGMPIDDKSAPPQINVKKPDIAIGLRRDDNIERLLGNNENVAHSPTLNTPEMLFPFLVLEAKSEVGGPGFQSVETQTAFPIRTFLNIQRSLSRSTNTGGPLVWFLAYQGEEWKVYGCTPDDRGTRVIELWQGTILRADCALQLCLIIDFIYDWAIEIYLNEILDCLFAGQERALSTYCSLNDRTLEQITELSQGSLSTCTLRDTISYSRDEEEMTTSSSDTIQADNVMSLPSERADDTEMLDTTIGADSPSSATIVESYPEADDMGVIRNADEVFFTFNHLVLPETEEELISILTSISPNDFVSEVAQALLETFCVEEPLVLNYEFINQVEELWTGSIGEHTSNAEEPVIANISFRSYLRHTDWQVLRNISCITATVRAINRLGSIALNGYDALVDGAYWVASNPSVDVVRSLRTLSGQESAATATENVCLILRKGPFEERWTKGLEAGDLPRRIWKGLDANTPSIPLFPILFYSSAVVRIEKRSGTDLGKILPRLSRTTRNDGALILKRPASWYRQCPKYCLVLFDGSDVEDEAHMGRTILQVLSHGGVYQEIGRGVQEVDRVAIEAWAARLLN
ncbi:hypothetical protein ETB97_005770 [Aspergillus alliaceus]|uniref:Uncharacterized protein n=1 Tax=Petromyces alliaceus TaxID=209559 RepID=A0A8H5ZV53_PETAA|nr:hypothetical protein ETB97_005770 [Aspergillus burnettii]